jgi:sec-independent protein translocase protein TatC
MFEILMMPLVRVLPPNSTLIFTGITEAFFTYMKVGFVAAVFFTSPFIFYQLWAFVAPGLYAHEKRWVIPFVVFSGIFFIGGALFGYFVVFPYGFKYLMGFASQYIRPFPSVKEYFSLAWKLLFAFGLVFEMPLVVLFLAKMGLVTSRFLVKNFKYAFLLIFIVAAVLTPTPDIANQCLMAFPMLGLYGLSIIVAMVFGKKPKKDEGVETQASEPDGKL